jgi:hypothetical protein
MDPNATLAEIRAALADMGRSDITPHEYADAASVLHERIEILDEWLSKGGFLPDAWKR